MDVRERGMTLLEVLLAVTVLTLGLFASAALQLRGLQAVEGARREGQALHLAQGMLERVRAAEAIEAGEEAAWQLRLTQVLGGAAQGRMNLAGGVLVLDVDWPGMGEGRQSLSVQGRVLP